MEKFRNFKKYIFFQKISQYQDQINKNSSHGIDLNTDDVYTFYFLYNTFSNFIPYLEELIIIYEDFFISNQSSLKTQLIFIVIIQFIVVILVIISQFIFIIIGYEKAKKKMKNLKIKIQSNNVLLTQKKVNEFMKFCDTFNIYSLYFIADFEISIRKPDNNNITNSSSMKNKNKSTSILSNKGNKSIKEIYSTDNNNTSNISELKKGQATPNFRLSFLENPLNSSQLINENTNYNSNLFGNHRSNTNKTGIFGSSNNVNFNHSFNNRENSILMRNSSKADYGDTNYSLANYFNNQPGKGDNEDHELNNLLVSNTKENLDISIFNQINTSKIPYLKKLSSIEPREKFIFNEIDNKSHFLDVLNKESEKISRGKTGLLDSSMDINKLKRIQSFAKSDDNSSNNLSVIKPDHSNINLLSLDSIGKTNKIFTKLNTGENNQLKKINLKRELTSKKKNYPEKHRIEFSNNPQYENVITNLNKKLEKFDDEVPQIPGINNNIKNLTTKKDSKFDYPVTLKKLEKLKNGETNNYNNSNSYINNNNLNINKNDSNLSDKSKDYELKDLKDMKISDMNILQDATLIKKKNEISKKDKPKEEDIDMSVEQIIYKNYIPKIFLLIFGLLFIILYSLNIYFNLASVSKITIVNQFSNLLQKRIGLLESLIFQYETSIVLNKTKIDFTNGFDKIYQNQENINTMIKNGGFNYLPLSYELESYLSDKEFCNYISGQFAIIYNSTVEKELLECQIIGNKMNSNGFYNSYDNIFNSLKVLYDDMKKLNDLSEDILIGKIMDYSYFNIKMNIDFTFQKLDELEKLTLDKDLDNVFSEFLNMENILFIISLILCIIFSFTSIIIVILPIKSVEVIISWLIHKLIKDL